MHLQSPSSTKAPYFNITIITPRDDFVFAESKTCYSTAVTHESRSASTIFTGPDLHYDVSINTSTEKNEMEHTLIVRS